MNAWLSTTALSIALQFVPATASADRPPLEVHRGNYFRWAAPQGWRASESINGVTLISPDDAQRAGFILLLRTPGRSTPRDFLLRFLPRDPAYRIVRIESQRALPDVPGGPAGGVWKVEELGLSLIVNGRPHRAFFTCAVKNAWGQYDGFFSYFHAGEAQWPAARQFLPQLTHSIAIVNPGQVAMNDQLLHPKNNPSTIQACLSLGGKRGSPRRRSARRGGRG